MTTEYMPDEARLRELLVGKLVAQAEISDERPESYSDGPTGYLTLSDGTRLKVWGNDGGCACSAGCYPLAHLTKVEGVITNVEVEARPDDEYEPCSVCGERWGCEHNGFYRIFVVTEAEGRSMLASFEGSDGNGYYGTGWYLSVEVAG